MTDGSDSPPAPRRRRLGTSSLVVAAFVGPGTVLTCASAGVRFDYALGWVLVFSALAVFVLQSFTAASGILARQGLGDALRDLASTPVVRGFVFTLVVLGLWVGCAAFETGNLLGAGAGLDVAFGWGREIPLVLCAAATALLLLLDLKGITRVLAGMVALMSVLFVSSAVMAGIDLGGLFSGLLAPRVPDGSILTVVALMGTTVVTYNLFLHASATKSYWNEDSAETGWKGELAGMALFIPLGGVVSIAILATGAALSPQEAPSTIAGFAILLEPAAGTASRFLFAAGLLAAGLTSAVTAPLAAAAGITELFAWDRGRYPWRFRGIWMSVIASGLLFGLTDVSPLKLIVAAQAANGILLPLIAGVVVFVAFRQSNARLPRWYLGLGVVIVAICAGLGVRTLVWVWGQLGF
ncbi:MAG: manganese transport protein [Rhodothermales bacterium]|jgi:manganese transport protein